MLQNDTAPGTQLGVMVRRMARPRDTNISSQEIFKYWEANIAGAPLFPDGIKMLVGSFPQLFGTEQGRRLQAWCRKQGWVLAWALGSVGADPDPHSHGGGGPYGRGSAPFANRSLDLQVRATDKLCLWFKAFAGVDFVVETLTGDESG